MYQIIIGYGDFEGYTLTEISDDLLRQLAVHYPLKIANLTTKWKQLFIIIGIHEELKRREAGGQKLKRKPTKKQLAEEIVAKGFHGLSKVYHPDKNGDTETQILLNEARDILQNICTSIKAEYAQNTITIKSSIEETLNSNIIDDDIPF